MDKKILKQLKTDYEELEIKPSDNLWDQIESGLDSGSEIAQKTHFQWWKYAAVVALLISVGSLFYFNSDKNSDIEKTVVNKNASESNFKPSETVEFVIPKQEINKRSNLHKTELIDHQKDLASKKSTEKIEVPENLKIFQNETKTFETPARAIEKPEVSIVKTVLPEKKKASYINADELLLGRELDKTRIESSEHKQFGILDASKLKFKRPGSLQIFGVHVFADSIVSE